MKIGKQRYFCRNLKRKIQVAGVSIIKLERKAKRVKQTQTLQARSKKVSITCKRVTFLMMDYLAKEIYNETTLIFKRHLSNCPDCAAFLSTYKKTVRTTQLLPCENIPVDAENRARKFLREKINELPASIEPR
jgi:hypothetical protein